MCKRCYHSFIRDATVTCDCSTLTTPIVFIDPASSNPNVRLQQLRSDACLFRLTLVIYYHFNDPVGSGPSISPN